MDSTYLLNDIRAELLLRQPSDGAKERLAHGLGETLLVEIDCSLLAKATELVWRQ